MTLISSSGQKVQELASRVERDIETRGLKTGDRYLTTVEVANLLGVSTRLANDAMRLLATRKVLMRKPKAGTVIGPAMRLADDEFAKLFDVIHLLIRQDYYFSERRRMEALVSGLSGELPGSSLQLNFVPAFNEQAYVERLLDANSHQRNAYLLAVKSTQLQRRFENQSSPAVLLGTRFQGITRLSWIDKDQAAIGRLLTQRLLEAGHRSIAVILRDRRGYGDDLMMDAIIQELMSVGLGSGALVARSVPTEPPLIVMAVRTLLESPNRPTAMICRNRMILNAVVQVCQTLGMTVGKDIHLAMCDAASGPDDVLPVPCLRPRVSLTAEAEGRMLAQMLTELHGDTSASKPREVLIKIDSIEA